MCDQCSSTAWLRQLAGKAVLVRQLVSLSARKYGSGKSIAIGGSGKWCDGQANGPAGALPHGLPMEKRWCALLASAY